jgi:diketogulonate reductase-like aldo/keto reductase
MEYVDLYMVHWPVTMKAGRFTAPFTPEDFEPFDMRAVWEAMEECHRLGLTKTIGVCNFSCKKLETLLSFATIPPVVNQVRWSSTYFQPALAIYFRCKSNMDGDHWQVYLWGNSI